jgi:transcriptional regulator with XRE-family HTH domain
MVEGTMEESKAPEPADIMVGARVRHARIEAGLSQGALAEQLGVSFQQVQKYENGSNRISASRLVQIADTLGVSATSFLQGLGQHHDAGAPQSSAGANGAEELMALYSTLPPSMREAVVQLARSLADGLARPKRGARSNERGTNGPAANA